jgi:hypothetical protein
MAAESLYLLVIIRFARQKIRGSNRTPGLTVLIRAFGRMPMSPIVGTEIPSAKATFGVLLLSMSDLAIYRQLTGERESRVCPKHSELTYNPVNEMVRRLILR